MTRAMNWISYGLLFAVSIASIYNSARASLSVENKNTEKISRRDAFVFPFLSSAFLFGLYVFLKALGKRWANALLSSYFVWAGSLLLYTAAIPHFPRMAGISFTASLSLKRREDTTRKTDFVVTLDQMLCMAFCALFSLLYFLTKAHLLNNTFALLLIHTAVKTLQIDSFSTAFLLFGGLFIYDVFWVSMTPVMVSVATQISLPLKLVVVINSKKAILGLGDVILPGLFSSLCLRFDKHRQRRLGREDASVSLRKTPYFLASLLGYTSGMLATFWALLVFKNPQPALLYLSPACVLSVLACAALRKETNQMLRFRDETKAESRKEK
ncbi:MAG: signal peptide peptidase [Amphiamblys sp. WSBS2006]|nr:MAG: signal peptide peptidase [Amphiamblys sp. WSBS2006]